MYVSPRSVVKTAGEAAPQLEKRGWAKGRTLVRPPCSETLLPFCFHWKRPANRERSHHRGTAILPLYSKAKRVARDDSEKSRTTTKQARVTVLQCRPKGAEPKHQRRPAVRALDWSLPHVAYGDTFMTHHNLKTSPHIRPCTP